MAGSDAKCAQLVDELGFDAAIKRRSPEFRSEFRAATLDRINVTKPLIWVHELWV